MNKYMNRNEQTTQATSYIQDEEREDRAHNNMPPMKKRQHTTRRVDYINAINDNGIL